MKINFEHSGNFNKLENFLTRTIHSRRLLIHILDKYGRKGVEALREATPKDTGKTANSWKYDIITNDQGKYEIVWSNTNVVNDWANVAILLQYGHATRNGGFVKGIDYINPAIQSIFENMANEAWEEVRQRGADS